MSSFRTVAHTSQSIHSPIFEEPLTTLTSPSSLPKSFSCPNVLLDEMASATTDRSLSSTSGLSWSLFNLLGSAVKKRSSMTTPQSSSLQKPHCSPSITNNTLDSTNHVTHLPEEILQYILYFFTREELLCKIQLVNSTFKRLALNRELWWHHTFVRNPHYVHQKRGFAIEEPFDDRANDSSLMTSSKCQCCEVYNDHHDHHSHHEPSNTIMYSSSLKKRIQHIFKVSTGCDANPAHIYKHENMDSKTSTSPSNHSSKVGDFAAPQLTSMEYTTLDCIHYFMEEKLTSTSISSTPIPSSNAPIIVAKKYPHIISEDVKLTQSLNGMILGDTQSDIAASISEYLFGEVAMNAFGGADNSMIHRIFPRYRHTMTCIPSNSATPNVMIIGGILTPRQLHAENPHQQGIYTMNALFVPNQWAFDVPRDHEVTCVKSYPNSSMNDSEPIHVDLPQMFGKHSAVYAPSVRSVIVFGGSYEDSVTSDLYHVQLTDAYFSSRFCTTANTKRDTSQGSFRRFLSPSRSVPMNLNTSDVLFQWQKIVKPNGMEWPSPRTNHCAVMLNDRTMIVLGGGVGNNMTPTNEVWAYDVVTRNWKNLTPLIENANLFTPRLGFAATPLNSHSILCFGGGYWVQNSPQDKYWRESYTDLFVLDLHHLKWTKIETRGEAPNAGTFPAFSPQLIGVHWYIIGGGMMWDVSSSIYQLNTVTWVWERVGESFGADSSCLVNLSMYTQGKNKVSTKLVHCGGYRYEPLLDAKVFSVNWKDQMDAKRKESTRKCVIISQYAQTSFDGTFRITPLAKSPNDRFRIVLNNVYNEDVKTVIYRFSDVVFQSYERTLPLFMPSQSIERLHCSNGDGKCANVKSKEFYVSIGPSGSSNSSVVYYPMKIQFRYSFNDELSDSNFVQNEEIELSSEKVTTLKTFTIPQYALDRAPSSGLALYMSVKCLNPSGTVCNLAFSLSSNSGKSETDIPRL
ncbi:hypothetical protein C9374_004136 [Naegleria lovaniensis]|uniref:F-box domain-containing protein n=1 Tax=Naegleria lovaniensis TaxID=51637 RepID=A0AA88KLB0_NAELO|nr:uncharacterized protein C9374_004136 [Naegleria lovaniensis]KAG2383465.1 hypothetical protein C9374_004136 [Naegleria lovaniensis]